LNAIPFITKQTFFKDVVMKSIDSIMGYEPEINNGGELLMEDGSLQWALR